MMFNVTSHKHVLRPFTYLAPWYTRGDTIFYNSSIIQLFCLNCIPTSIILSLVLFRYNIFVLCADISYSYSVIVSIIAFVINLYYTIITVALTQFMYFYCLFHLCSLKSFLYTSARNSTQYTQYSMWPHFVHEYLRFF